MDLRGVPKSKNVVDRTRPGSPGYMSPDQISFVKTLFGTDLPPDGYENWFKETMSSLGPDDYRMMKEHGMSLTDILFLKNFKAGHFGIDPTAVPYGKGGGVDIRDTANIPYIRPKDNY